MFPSIKPTRLLVLLSVAAVILVARGPMAAQVVPTPSRVVIVIEENHSFSEIVGSASAPYISSLAARGATFTNSFGVTHPSEPNYLALFSGSTQGVTDDGCSYTFTTPNLASFLLSGGWTFGGYSEDLPAVGSTVCSSQKYFRKHNAWVDWQSDIVTSPYSLPPSVNMPFTSFPADYSLLPTVSIVVPNQNNDMHDGTIQQADTWLQTHLDSFVQWANENNGLLILTWDEDDGGGGNRIPTIFVGQAVKAGSYPETINHYNVLRTIEDMYGLPHAGNSATATAITDVWTTSSPVAPSNLSAVAVSSSQINLTWTDNSSDETQFEISRSTNGRSFSVVATVGANVTTFASSGLTRNTKYYFRVRASNANGFSAYSNVTTTRTRPK
jgi:hypothetical protein